MQLRNPADGELTELTTRIARDLEGRRARTGEAVQGGRGEATVLARHAAARAREVRQWKYPAPALSSGPYSPKPIARRPFTNVAEETFFDIRYNAGHEEYIYRRI